MDLTYFKNYRFITSLTTKSAAFLDHIKSNFTHTTHPLETKLEQPLFGPYVLKGVRCDKHKTTRAAHRCDKSVKCLTAAVFDMDQGNEEQMLRTSSLLRSSKIESFIYSTHSYVPGKVFAYRLIIPFSQPLYPTNWKDVRENIMKKYLIQADPNSSKGVSHSYFMPTTQPGVKGYSKYIPGEPLNPDQFILFKKPYYPSFIQVQVEPARRTTSIPIEELRAKIEKKIERFERDSEDKAEKLQLLLEGNPLANHGKRNITATKVTGMVAWMFSDVPALDLLELFKPSLLAMQKEGSKLTEEQILGMLVRAQGNYHKRKAEDDAIFKALGF